MNSEIEQLAERISLVALIAARDGSEFDGEIHLSSEEGERIAAALAAHRSGGVGAEPATIGVLRHECAKSGPCAESGDGCTCSAGELVNRHNFIVGASGASPAIPADHVVVPFQDRVAEAHVALFHDDPTDLPERRDRFYEEATETAQALGMTEDDAHRLVAYTFARPAGDVQKEIGAAALTLASLCVIGGWDMMACAEADLAALITPEKIAKVRAKRATRHGRGPLPGYDPAAPSAPASPPVGGGTRTPDFCYLDAEWEATYEWSNRDTMMDDVPLGVIEKVRTFFNGPTKWMVHAPTSWTDGEPDGWQLKVFDSEEAAKLALIAPPSTEGDGK